MFGVGVRSILLLPLVARCLETIDVFIWRMFLLGVCWNVCCVADVVKNSFSLGVLKYVVGLCKGCDGFSVCIVRRGAVGARVWEV